MPGVIANRLFPVLQLTRMALVFTAISNSLATLLIWTARRYPGQSVLQHLDWRQVALMVLVSTGLYGFGMSLNDIIDRRRDSQISPNRPLPSGRIGVATAHVICGLLIALALLAGWAYARMAGPQGWMSIVLVAFTAALIVFYDLAAKYLVALGLLSLGLIRFFHAVVPAPQLPLLWHPLVLLTHVTLLSLIAYRWEEKRPALTPLHWAGVAGGLLACDGLLVGLIVWRRGHFPLASPRGLWITPQLIAPLAAMLVFIALAWVVRRHSPSPREAGQRLMLYGLLWLIVYDFTFVAGYVGLVPAFGLLLLLPLAYASVQVMRWWGGVVALSQRPQFKRVET